MGVVRKLEMCEFMYRLEIEQRIDEGVKCQKSSNGSRVVVLHGVAVGAGDAVSGWHALQTALALAVEDLAAVSALAVSGGAGACSVAFVNRLSSNLTGFGVIITRGLGGLGRLGWLGRLNRFGRLRLGRLGGLRRLRWLRWLRWLRLGSWDWLRGPRVR